MGFEARGTSLYFLGARSTVAAVIEKPLIFLSEKGWYFDFA